MHHEEPDPPFELGEPPSREGVDELKRAVEREFPEESKQTSADAIELWDTDEACLLWFGQFAKRTNEAILQRDVSTVTRHFAFFSRELAAAGPDVVAVIDVGYVENLLAQMDEESQQWGWNLMPANLRDMFYAFWSKIAPQRMRELMR